MMLRLTGRIVVAFLLLVSLSACTRLMHAHKYFLRACPADGPAAEEDFTIAYPPFNLAAYYSSLSSLGQRFHFEKAGVIQYFGADYPVFAIMPTLHHHKPRVLVVAGVHGNEQAATLAIPRLLQALQSVGEERLAWQPIFLTPANPVGAAYRSRYNGQGCDVNRDFADFQTEEARIVRRIMEAVQPDLVLSLHEGPQQGFFMIATAAARADYARRIVETLEKQGVTLARDSFLGWQLNQPGISVEGQAVAALKRWIGLGSLGTYLEAQGVGTLTLESGWAAADYEERINNHVQAVMAVLLSPPDGADWPGSTGSATVSFAKVSLENRPQETTVHATP